MHKILLVDDMRSFLDLEATFLARAECRILTAATGLEGIRVARAEKPDLVVLDIEMPEMNGIEFLRERKRLGIEVPVVILSSIAKKGAEVFKAQIDAAYAEQVAQSGIKKSAAEVDNLYSQIQDRAARQRLDEERLALDTAELMRMVIGGTVLGK